MDLLAFLKETSYPGRGIVIGSDRAYYFIMGRSENSRNRVFVPTEDGIRTEAHDPAKLTDPSLIIYHPVRTMGDGYHQRRPDGHHLPLRRFPKGSDDPEL